ncbi:MAG: RNA-guided endonuclease InsQ/TnpB family protein, partial [Bacilli bacterium]
YAHQTSHSLVSDERCTLYAFEDLKIQNMTRRPKAKKDEKGRWIPNGAAAKAGLNRAILSSAWGQIVQYTEYKALRAGKLVVKVPFAYSSQECAFCGYTHKDNRLTQAEFVCLRCGHTDNADHNAAVVIAHRGVTKILSGGPLTKPKKSVRMRKTVGPERSEPVQSAQKPEETDIRRDAGDPCVAHKSTIQETPAAMLETPA